MCILGEVLGSLGSPALVPLTTGADDSLAVCPVESRPQKPHPPHSCSRLPRVVLSSLFSRVSETRCAASPSDAANPLVASPPSCFSINSLCLLLFWITALLRVAQQRFGLRL